MKARYPNEHYKARIACVERLKNQIERQNELMDKMLSGDGRTVEFREVAKKFDTLEDSIQSNISALNDIAKKLQ